LIANTRVVEITRRRIPGDIEEDNSVDFVVLELRCEVLAVAFQGNQLCESLPLASQEILAAHLPVEHLVPEARVEFLGVGLWKRHGIHEYNVHPHKLLLRSACMRSDRQPEYTAVVKFAYPSTDRRSAHLRILEMHWLRMKNKLQR